MPRAPSGGRSPCIPRSRLVYVVNDFTSTGKAIAQGIRNDLKEFAPDVKVRFSGNLILPEIVAQVKTLPKDSLILFGSYHRDRMGRFYDIAEAVLAISEETDLPVYGLYDFDLGHGIVGGMLSSGYNQGQAMAQIALHVLSGRRPGDIPVLREGVSAPMFDYEMLKKHRIGMENLPENSEIINRPRTFYTEHLELIWLGLGFAAVQMIIILALVVNTSRRRQAEKELRRAHQLLEERVRERTGEVKESVEALRTVFDASHDGIFIHDATGHILDCNARMLKMYGLNPDDIRDLSIGPRHLQPQQRGLPALLHLADRDQRRAAIFRMEGPAAPRRLGIRRGSLPEPDRVPRPGGDPGQRARHHRAQGVREPHPPVPVQVRGHPGELPGGHRHDQGQEVRHHQPARRGNLRVCPQGTHRPQPLPAPGHPCPGG